MARKCKYTFRPDCEGLEGRQLLSTINNVYNGKVLAESDAYLKASAAGRS